MKKSFLLVSALSVLGFANAQNNAAHIGVKNMAKIDANQTAVPGKPISIPTTKAASTIDIGTSYNVFTILGDRQNQVVYNPDINTVAFVHRQNAGGAGGSGIISLDYSTDGGANWTVNPYQTTPTGSGSSWNGNRYPNIALYAPTTTAADAYAIEVGPALETGITSGANGWAKTFRASHKLDGSNLDETYDFNSTATNNDYNDWGASGLYVNANGVAWYATTNVNNETVGTNDVADYYSEYNIIRGDYNSTNNNFDWTVVQTITPGWTTTDNGGTQFNCATLMNMAWSPDGNTGYLVMMGAWGGTNTMMRPYVMKTTDAGANWSQYPDFDFSTDAQLQCMVRPTLSAQETRPFFGGSFDLVVDNNGDLKIFTEIGSGYSAHPDSLLYTFSASQFGHLWEVSTNSSNGWDISFIDSIYVADHEWDATNGLSHFLRPQASRSADGTKVFYTWLHSDPLLSLEREFPVVNAIGHDIASDNWTAITNLSAGTAADYVSAYATTAVDAISGGTEKNFELPIVYGTAVGGGALSDGLTTAQWSYLRGVGFDSGEFTNPTPNACTISIGEEEIAKNDLTVYPNPTTGSILIHVDGVEGFNFTVVDLVGNLIATEVVNGDNTMVDLSANAKGVYFVNINTAKGSIARKVILTK